MESGKDSCYYGRFEIPAADLSLVFGKNPEDPSLQEGMGEFHFSSHPMTETWWHPEQIPNPQYAGWSVPGFCVNIKYGNSGEKGMLTVYFFNFSM